MWTDLLSGWEAIGRREKNGEPLLLGELSHFLPMQRATMVHSQSYDVGMILSGGIIGKE